MNDRGHWSLAELLDRLPAPGEPITDGRPYLSEEAPKAFVVRGAGYLPIVSRMWETLKRAGFPSEGQHDYGEWRDRYLAQAGAEWFTPGHVATMSRTDCFYLLRTLQRSERFCDGAWSAAHEAGLFHAVVRRLIELSGRD